LQHRPTLIAVPDPPTTALRAVRLPMVAWLATALVAVAATTACALRLNENPAVFACCYFAAVGTVLSAIDIAVMRLPDALTLPSYPVLLIALA
jgi:leader peptidase (prepilin peptidase)/N-methyltransferase